MPEHMSEERLQEVLTILDGMADDTYEDQAAGFLYDVRNELARSRSEENGLRAALIVAREEAALKDVEIARLQNVAQLLGTLAEGCSVHPRYHAVRACAPGCPTCDAMWRARQRLNKEA